MALPSSGAISMNDVNVELGYSGTATISLNDAAVRSLFGIASGAISLSDGYGLSAGGSIYAQSYFGTQAQMALCMTGPQNGQQTPTAYAPVIDIPTPLRAPAQSKSLTPTDPDRKIHIAWNAGPGSQGSEIGSTSHHMISKQGIHGSTKTFDNNMQYIRRHYLGEQQQNPWYGRQTTGPSHGIVTSEFSGKWHWNEDEEVRTYTDAFYYPGVNGWGAPPAPPAPSRYDPWWDSQGNFDPNVHLLNYFANENTDFGGSFDWSGPRTPTEPQNGYQYSIEGPTQTPWASEFVYSVHKWNPAFANQTNYPTFYGYGVTTRSQYKTEVIDQYANDPAINLNGNLYRTSVLGAYPSGGMFGYQTNYYEHAQWMFGGGDGSDYQSGFKYEHFNYNPYSGSAHFQNLKSLSVSTTAPDGTRIWGAVTQNFAGVPTITTSTYTRQQLIPVVSPLQNQLDYLEEHLQKIAELPDYPGFQYIKDWGPTVSRSVQPGGIATEDTYKAFAWYADDTLPAWNPTYFNYTTYGPQGGSPAFIYTPTSPALNFVSQVNHTVFSILEPDNTARLWADTLHQFGPATVITQTTVTPSLIQGPSSVLNGQWAARSNGTMAQGGQFFDNRILSFATYTINANFWQSEPTYRQQAGIYFFDPN